MVEESPNPAPLEHSRKTMKESLDLLTTILDNITSDELNAQPFPTRRTIGEIVNHVIRVTSWQLPFVKMIYRTNKSLVRKVHSRPVDASDYRWRTEKGKPRKPKQFRRDDLVKRFLKQKEKILARYEKYAEKDRGFAHYETRHISSHVKQIQIILDHLKSQ